MTVLSGAGLELIFFGGDGDSGIEVFSSICAVVSLIDFCFILGVLVVDRLGSCFGSSSEVSMSSVEDLLSGLVCLLSLLGGGVCLFSSLSYVSCLLGAGVGLC